MSDEQNSALVAAVGKRISSRLLQRIPIIGDLIEALTIGIADEAEKNAEKARLLELLETNFERLATQGDDHSVKLDRILALLEGQPELRAETRQRIEHLRNRRIALSELRRHYADELIGREDELRLLQEAWDDELACVYSIIAWGGAGKTSLAAEFRKRFAPEDRLDCDGYLDFSFYQQGASNYSGSSESFFSHAAAHLKLDIEELSLRQKAEAVAEQLAQGRWLLILDGLEPLQQPPGSGDAGRLRDEGIRTLLECLTQRQFPGLCLLTSRERVLDFERVDSLKAPLLELEKLSDAAGAQLLHRAGAKRCGAADIARDHPELQAASAELRGHPLSLQILGGYLDLAHGGDIRRRSVALTDAASDIEFTARNVERLLSDYVLQLAQSDKGRRMLAVLRLLGLFDRAAQRHCLDRLRAAPIIPGLNDGLFTDGDESRPAGKIQWNASLRQLAELKLIEISDQPDGDIDCHPLIRDYFAAQLKPQTAAWRAGHRRLFEQLCEHTDYRPDGEAGLRPLFQAVVHGCLAGEYLRALGGVNAPDGGVYIDRILRGTGSDGFYSTTKLGLFASELAALGGFFADGDGGPDWQRFSEQAGEQLGRGAEVQGLLRKTYSLDPSTETGRKAGAMLDS